MIIHDPSEIERRSFEIISSELKTALPPENELVVKRVIHTTADFDYAENLVFRRKPSQRRLRFCVGAAASSPIRKWQARALTKPPPESLAAASTVLWAIRVLPKRRRRAAGRAPPSRWSVRRHFHSRLFLPWATRRPRCFRSVILFKMASSAPRL